MDRRCRSRLYPVHGPGCGGHLAIGAHHRRAHQRQRHRNPFGSHQRFRCRWSATDVNADTDADTNADTTARRHVDSDPRADRCAIRDAHAASWLDVDAHSCRHGAANRYFNAGAYNAANLDADSCTHRDSRAGFHRNTSTHVNAGAECDDEPEFDAGSFRPASTDHYR